MQIYALSEVGKSFPGEFLALAAGFPSTVQSPKNNEIRNGIADAALGCFNLLDLHLLCLSYGNISKKKVLFILWQ